MLAKRTGSTRSCSSPQHSRQRNPAVRLRTSALLISCHVAAIMIATQRRSTFPAPTPIGIYTNRALNQSTSRNLCSSEACLSFRKGVSGRKNSEAPHRACLIITPSTCGAWRGLPCISPARTQVSQSWLATHWYLRCTPIDQDTLNVKSVSALELRNPFAKSVYACCC
ncbi:hypothetical protein BD410DRAFT_286010 [Rickenella mellea]|uniref:Uncharacterized protein n=1 Tax=Rickenella mellea TaxID=50990 RepID=A0A4Y7Q332_9AGAM|nr:hypothetical protein BD410DRAFT_286010 [Rickenella mellea]